MDDDGLKVGQQVRLPETYQRGRVVEVDMVFYAARVELNDGFEVWQRLDELEAVEPWDVRRRLAYRNVGDEK
jgi:hypothetical protein